jgi:hypothetical protein
MVDKLPLVRCGLLAARTHWNGSTEPRAQPGSDPFLFAVRRKETPRGRVALSVTFPFLQRYDYGTVRTFQKVGWKVSPTTSVFTDCEAAYDSNLFPGVTH